jgi:hypothetical protein
MSTHVAPTRLDFDDDAMNIAKLARKATRKAARDASRAGFSVERKGNVCIVKSPNSTVRVMLKTTTVDVYKRYTFQHDAR